MGLKLPRHIEEDILARSPPPVGVKLPEVPPKCPACGGAGYTLGEKDHPWSDLSRHTCDRCKGTGKDPHNPLSEPFTDEVGRGEVRSRGSMVALTLPWPPSVNHYWRHVGPKVLISQEGRKYRRAVADAVTRAFLEERAWPLDGRLSVSILAYPPDRRERDLDNLLKGTLDALQKAGLYRSDSLIDDLRVRRCPPHDGGRLILVARALKGDTHAD